MKPERWQRVAQIYNAALERQPDQRETFLEQVCTGDDSLRKEVESLLACQTEARGFIESPAMAVAAEELARNSGSKPDADMLGRMFLHYRIEKKIGAGGMGIVFQAHDSHLGRQVAIKMLPDFLVSDPERKARFAREARLLATLNHPNIASIYGFEEAEGKPFLVLELVAGKTLADKLKKGPIPLEETLGLCSQIAEGLEAAHEKGIIHRDLKPSNIKLTAEGKVKVLDFGLAKVFYEQPEASVEESQSTATGVVLGTAAYMSPEQASGKAVDKRADIWALGCILFECLTGKRPFGGETVTETLAAVIKEEPDWAALAPATPHSIRKLLERCLRKNPKERMHDIADARLEIEDALKLPTESTQTIFAGFRRGRLWGWLIFAAGLLFGAIGGIVLWRNLAPHPIPTRMNVSVSEWGLTLTDGGLAISPDGQTLAFVAHKGDEPRIYVRRWNDFEPRPLNGTEGATNPFFSPDGEWIAFTVSRSGMKKVSVRGGPTFTICGGVDRASRGTWGQDDRIIFGQWPRMGLWRVSAESGKPEPLARPSAGEGVWYLYPDLLPGGRDVVFTILRQGHSSIASLSLQTGKIKQLIASGFRGRYLSTGHLIYESEGHLRAVAFDQKRLETHGASSMVIENFANLAFRSHYDVSLTGTLAYSPPLASQSNLVWKDLTGNIARLELNQHNYSFPAASPDGKRVAATVWDGPARNIWIGSVGDARLTRLTYGDDDVFSLFTRDGKRVLFTSGQNGRYNIFSTPADGSGSAIPVTDNPNAQKATSVSPDGKVLLFNEQVDPGGMQIMQMEIDRPGSVRPFRATPFDELEGVFSPDGLWVAYQSNDSGHWEVYVQPYSGPGPRTKVSIDGGKAPAWHPRGDRLFYQGPAAMMVLQLVNGRPMNPPRKLFAYTGSEDSPGRVWDIAPDGQRFLMIERASASHINIVTNWFEELKVLVPTGKQ